MFAARFPDLLIDIIKENPKGGHKGYGKYYYRSRCCRRDSDCNQGNSSGQQREIIFFQEKQLKAPRICFGSSGAFSCSGGKQGQPAIHMGLIQMTVPEKSNSRNQRCVKV